MLCLITLTLTLTASHYQTRSPNVARIVDRTGCQ